MNWKPNICGMDEDRCVVDIEYQGKDVVVLGPRGFQSVCTLHRSHANDAARLQAMVGENREMSYTRAKLAQLEGLEDDAITFAFDNNRHIELTPPGPLRNRGLVVAELAKISNRVTVK